MITQILSVSHLTTILKGIIEDDDDLQDLWLDGEISNLTIARSGHAYFSLKDDQSQFRAVMWRHALSRQQMVPKEGDRVIAHGNVTVYQPRGAMAAARSMFSSHRARGCCNSGWKSCANDSKPRDCSILRASDRSRPFLSASAW